MESLPKQVQKEESKKQAPSTTNKQPAKTTQKVNKLPKEESKVPVEESKFDTAPVKTALKPEDSQIFHGSLGNPHWEAPAVTFKSNEVARKGDNYISFSKTEFKDKPEVLKEKVKLLAEMVKKSELLVAYTGAGISRNAGIADYASAKNTVKAGVKTLAQGSYRSAKPTKAHYVITELIKKGHVKHWLQQNHDGLAQKSGCPQSMVNEIHGSWYDKSNPVVKMSGKLKTENYECMENWIQLQDMCIAVGSSLVGMNSDNIVREQIDKFNRSNGKLALGCVIINNQQTQYHLESQLNIYNDIDDTFMLLAKELGIEMAKNPKVYEQKDWIK